MPKKRLDQTIMCQNCGAKMAIYAIKDSRCMAQCHGCGSISFFPDFLLERLKYAEHVCPHQDKLEKTTCKGGETSFCQLCRMRSFFYRNKGLS